MMKRKQYEVALEAELFRRALSFGWRTNGLKKISAATVEEKRQLVERESTKITVARQCELLGLWHSSCYYSSSRDDGYNLELMRVMYSVAGISGIRTAIYFHCGGLNLFSVTYENV